MLLERIYYNDKDERTSVAIRRVIDFLNRGKTVLYLSDNKDNYNIEEIIKARDVNLELDLNKLKVIISGKDDIVTHIQNSNEFCIVLDVEDCISIPDVDNWVYLYCKGWFDSGKAIL
jgi:hypothetical protein